MKRLFIGVAWVALLAACEARTEPPVGSIDDPIVGAWRTGEGVPQMTFTFEADGTYRMRGAPAIGEAGRWSIRRVEDGDYRISFTERRRCRPCLEAGPDQDAPNSVEPALLDGDTLRFRNARLSRAALLRKRREVVRAKRDSRLFRSSGGARGGRSPSRPRGLGE